MQASKIEKCQFTISNRTINTNMEQQMNKYSAMRRWVFLLVTAANNDIAEGRTQQSLEKNITVIRISSHLYQQPTLIDLLVAIAVEAISYSPLKRFIVTGDATEEHLSFIEKALAGNKHNWSSDLPRILDYEKLIAKEEFAGYYEVNPKGRIRLSRDPGAKMRACWKEQLEAHQIEDQQIREVLESYLYPTYWQKKFIRAKTILYWFYIPSTPQKAAKIIDASYEKYYAMAEPGFDWKKEPREFPITSLFRFNFNYRFTVQSLANMLESSFYKIHEQYLRTIAGQRGCQLIIALRRYKNKNGHWPETLDEIKTLALAEIFVDPFNNGSFVYKLTDDSFKLYSKGLNNIDEDGKYKRRYGETSEGDDWLIWPPRTRKTQKENPDNE